MKYIFYLIFLFGILNCSNRDEDNKFVEKTFVLEKSEGKKEGVIVNTKSYVNSCKGNTTLVVISNNQVRLTLTDLKKNNSTNVYECISEPSVICTYNSNDKSFDYGSNVDLHNYEMDENYFKIIYNYSIGDGFRYQEISYYKRK